MDEPFLEKNQIDTKTVHVIVKPSESPGKKSRSIETPDALKKSIKKRYHKKSTNKSKFVPKSISEKEIVNSVIKPNFGKLMKRFIYYERRKYIFLTLNTSFLVISFFCMMSPTNLEGRNSLIINKSHNPDNYISIFALIVAQIMVHLLKAFTAILGFFGIFHKSHKIMTIFIFFLILCIGLRGILAILILVNYEKLEDVLKTIQVNNMVAIGFCVQIVILSIVDICIALICLFQANKSKDEYFEMKQSKEKIKTNKDITFQLALSAIKS